MWDTLKPFKILVYLLYLLVHIFYVMFVVNVAGLFWMIFAIILNGSGPPTIDANLPETIDCEYLSPWHESLQAWAFRKT